MLLLAKTHAARQALHSVHMLLGVCQSCKDQTVLLISAGEDSNRGANAFGPCSESKGILESGASGPAHSPARIESHLFTPTCGQ